MGRVIAWPIGKRKIVRSRKLLNQLRIDRAEPGAVRRSFTLWWTLALASAIGGVGLTAWYFPRGAAVPIRTAVAISLRKESAPRGAASLLDASGYIVARRRATVASKVTGKVIEVSLIAISGHDSIVYVVHDSIVERCVVKLGAKNGTQQTVIAGLKSGSIVATGDLSRLRTGAKVRVVD